MLPLVELSLLTALTVPPSPKHAVQPSLNPVSITTVLPADTPLVAFVNTKVEDWQSLNRFQLFKTVASSAMLLPSGLESRNMPLIWESLAAILLPGLQFDYERDVQPWLGDKVALVMLPQVGSKAVSIDTNFLALAPVKDDRALKLLLDKLKDKRQQVTQRQYKGITILEWKLLKPSQAHPPKPSFLSSKNPSLPNLNKLKGKRIAVAFLPQYKHFAVAQIAQPIEQLIDTSNSARLAHNPNFQKTSQNPHFNQALFTVYQNPAKYLAFINSLLKDSNYPNPITAIKPEQLQVYKSIDGFFWVKPEGLHLQVNTYFKAPQKKSANTPSSNAKPVLTRVPAPAYSTVTGRSLQQYWQAIATTFSYNPELEKGLAQFKNSFRSFTGLDIDRDVFAWMDGEYAFFFYPTKQGLLNSLYDKMNLSMGFLVQTSDRPTAEKTLQRLGTRMKSFSPGGMETSSHSISGIPIISWEAQQQSFFAYSWVDNKTLLITPGLGAIKELLPQPRRLLTQDYNFTTATRSLPQPNSGYFYLNFGSSLSWAYNLIPADSSFPGFSTFKQAIGSIYSISATSSTIGNREQLDSLIILAPARK